MLRREKETEKGRKEEGKEGRGKKEELKRGEMLRRVFAARPMGPHNVGGVLSSIIAQYSIWANIQPKYGCGTRAISVWLIFQVQNRILNCSIKGSTFLAFNSAVVAQSSMAGGAMM